MSVAYQGSAQTQATSTGTTATLSYTIAVAGSMLVAFGFMNYNQIVSVSDTKGNVWAKLGDFGGWGSIYYCSVNNGAGATTLTFTGNSPGDYCFIIGEYSGPVRLTKAVIQTFAATLQSTVNCGPVPATIAGAIGFITSYQQCSSYTSSSGSTVRTAIVARTTLVDNLNTTGPYTETAALTGNMQFGGSFILLGFTPDVPITLVNHAEGSSWSATAITSISTAAFNAVAGNTLLLVHNNVPFGSIIRDTAGNTFNQIGTNNGMQFWLATNIKGNANNIITADWSAIGTSSFIYLSATQWTGLDSKNPLDTSAITLYGTQPTIQNPFSPQITTKWPYEALVGWVQSSDAAATVGTGWTFIANPGAAPELVEYQIVQSVQVNVQATAFESTLQNWGMAIIALAGSGQQPSQVAFGASNPEHAVGKIKISVGSIYDG